MALSRHPLSPTPQSLGNVPVDRALVAVLASSFREIQKRGPEFADRFYASLFAAHPKLRSMFPPDMAAQKTKLLDTLATVITQLSEPASNLYAIRELGERHK